MNHDIETQLRAQRWREPPPQFLDQVLRAALEESRQRPGERQPSGARERLQAHEKLQGIGALQDASAPNKRPWLLSVAFIPRPLRLPLAACWLLALFFRLTTPEAVPQATLDQLAKLPAPLTPAQLLAHLEHAERLAHELLEQLRGPQPPL